jgi:hypothetical protein
MLRWLDEAGSKWRRKRGGGGGGGRHVLKKDEARNSKK